MKMTEPHEEHFAKEYRVLFNQVFDLVAIYDEDERFVDANESALKLLGYSKEEIKGLSLRDSIFLPEDSSQYVKIWSEIREKGVVTIEEVTLVGKSGKRIIVEGAGVRYEVNGKMYFLSCVRDITARKKAEEALHKALAEITELKNRLEIENTYLRDEIDQKNRYKDNVIGVSTSIKTILQQVEEVAPTKTTVLLQGETGTGKGLLANTIHNLSPRNGHPMVTVNCASIPSTLVESELFGWEKGAFTGAESRRCGRFEVADRSTIFLDEISEMPLELQVKLLRVLEEKKFERLGSTKTLDVDIRVIAATNRDLAKAVREGRFRQDLFYRLNVVPITVTPLRDRVDDIPLLTWAFVDRLSKQMGKEINRISQSSIGAMKRYPWPGNIRELKNTIERSMVLSKGKTLKILLPDNSQGKMKKKYGLEKLRNVEKDHIISVLKHTRWRVKGPNGAAEILGLKPTTLYSRMKKLGISRPI